MAKLVFALHQSLDGYIDHTEFSPPPALFSHFIELVRSSAGFLYGRRMYEVVRYWDDDGNVESAEDHEFAAALFDRVPRHPCDAPLSFLRFAAGGAWARGGWHQNCTCDPTTSQVLIRCQKNDCPAR